MRVYVPLTLPGLAAAYQDGELGPAPLTAYAVTPALREWYVSDDLEELEYAALSRAGRASLRLLAVERPGGEAGVRRVVVAADVPDRAVGVDPDLTLDPAGLGEVRIEHPVPFGRAAAVHLDGDEAAADVQAAIEALGAADLGDADARFTVDGAEDHELLWYGVQELENLL